MSNNNDNTIPANAIIDSMFDEVSVCRKGMDQMAEILIHKSQPDGADVSKGGKPFSHSKKSGKCPKCHGTKGMRGKKCQDCGEIMKSDEMVAFEPKPIRNVLRDK